MSFHGSHRGCGQWSLPPIILAHLPKHDPFLGSARVTSVRLTDATRSGDQLLGSLEKLIDKRLDGAACHQLDRAAARLDLGLKARILGDSFECGAQGRNSVARRAERDCERSPSL